MPVLLDRVLALLAPALDRAGSGRGRRDPRPRRARAALLARTPALRLVGLDRDPRGAAARRRAAGPVRGPGHPGPRRLRRAPACSPARAAPRVEGVLFDLGVSSLQLDEARPRASPTPRTRRWTCGWTRAGADRRRGGQHLPRGRAGPGAAGVRRGAVRPADRDAVVRERARRAVHLTARLAELVRDAIPAATRRTGGHPAKRTFQALRIEVNGELDALGPALPAALDALAVGGRIVVLAYHSLEDRPSSARSPPARRAPRRPTCRCPGRARARRLRCSPGGPRRPATRRSRQPAAASVRLRAAERSGTRREPAPRPASRAGPSPGRQQPRLPGWLRHGTAHAAGRDGRETW